MKMKTITKILIGLFITTFLACNKLTHQVNTSSVDQSSVTNYKSNLSLTNGKYEIDTGAILNNNNLQQLIADIEKTEFVEKKTVAEIPIFIYSLLDSLTGDFSIANSGEDWQVGCTSMILVDDGKGKITIEKPPKRQLIYFGLGQDLALMTYYTGGYGKSEHILIFKFENNNILDFWCGNVLEDVKSKSEILNYLKENKDKNWGLNTNIIHL